MMGPSRFIFLALPVALLVAGIAPAVGLAQPAETHGEVSQVSGDQVVIQLDEPTTVSDTARGRVFAQGETSTAVAEVTVQSTRGTLVLGRIAEELGRATVQTGQRVIFPALRTGATGGENATVSLESVPKGATVHLVAKRNSRTLGTTPTLAKLPPGSHRLRFRKSGYIPLDRVVTVRPDTVQGVRVTLKALDQPVVAQKGTLSVRPSPDSAVVFVDGSKVGTGRAQVPVSGGTHRVRATAHGYTAKAESLTVEGEEHRRVAIDLSRDTSALRVTSRPTQAFVSVDGEQVGRTPLTTTQPAGSHMVVVEKSGYTAVERSVTVTKGAKDTLRLALRRPLDVELATQQEGPVQNPRLTREDDEVRVQYSLPSAEASYEVEMQLSMNGGGTYQDVPDEVVSGDVGDEVQPGPGREIRWRALEQHSGGLTGDENRVRIAAEKVSTTGYPGRPGFFVEAGYSGAFLSFGEIEGNSVGGFEAQRILGRVGYASSRADLSFFVQQAGLEGYGGRFDEPAEQTSGAKEWSIGTRVGAVIVDQGDTWPIALYSSTTYTYRQQEVSSLGNQFSSAQTHELRFKTRAYHAFSLGDSFDIAPHISYAPTVLTLTRVESPLGTNTRFGTRGGSGFWGGVGMFLGSSDFGFRLEVEGGLPVPIGHISAGLYF
jgi:hypothetical protein